MQILHAGMILTSAGKSPGMNMLNPYNRLDEYGQLAQTLLLS